MTDTDELVKRIAEVIDGKAGKGFMLAEVVEGFRVLQARVKELEAQLAARGEPVYWQWRKISEHWSSEFIFSFEVKATDEDSEVRKLFTAPAVPAGMVLYGYLLKGRVNNNHCIYPPTHKPTDINNFTELYAAAPKGE